ncbi:alpha-1:3/1:6-mannosyltransferase ALG2-like protein [Dinothrombium tinctorium]|uniref:Alpha-1,3/1,6-mannosyltransferase ALG2 n=1 Tax=Dinothrombium tinctorium TaxID=1965070 RepID=A0A443R955_9ACAR|nr:alpha-1:3/1:6-mannosyltransferase ALG2-like protein [Dinothrombium tinctorium]RWS11807.1 alpha-1:3/1:6-mannosyltransferase ALG2-like protein [Dinothrombium tinctorium]
MKFVFLHPDLGIGGAERLIVDFALAVKQNGHDVQMMTAHHDINHCFQETKDGTLDVTVVGDWIPRSIFGKCYALCAYLRMLAVALYLVFTKNPQFSTFDIIVCDQISVCIPVLKCFLRFRSKKNAKIIFYCHFPDQLLTRRDSLLKKFYRAPIDWVEEVSTGLADCILVNSHFTAGIFRKTFTRLSDVEIDVLYPTCKFSTFDKPLSGDFADLNVKRNVDAMFVSINRYERKKNLPLALHAFVALESMVKKNNIAKTAHLIMVGGYDERVVENKEHFEELIDLAQQLKISDQVTFLKSQNESQVQLLLHISTAVLYTPENEHFGIVPLEAMYMKRPVIACNSGGPLETIIDGETGFLCDPSAESFAEAMYRFVIDKSLARELGINGHERVKTYFSFSAFVKKIKTIINDLSASSN